MSADDVSLRLALVTAVSHFEANGAVARMPSAGLTAEQVGVIWALAPTTRARTLGYLLAGTGGVLKGVSFDLST